MKPAWELSYKNNRAELRFDLSNEKVNKLTTAAMQELDRILDRLAEKKGLQCALITSGKKDHFIAGADIQEIEAITSHEIAFKKSQAGQKIFNKLNKLPFPTIAVINGACMGGGLELALACAYRVATDHEKTVLGLPEVSLGIIPGFGGTQRFPRLIGITRSLSLMLKGELITSQRAYNIKLVDALYPSATLENELQAFIEKITNRKKSKQIVQRRKQQPRSQKIMEMTFIGRRILFSQTRKKIMQNTKGHYPAPLALLKVVKSSCRSSLENGLLKERIAFAELAPGPVSKNLVQLYFTRNRLKKAYPVHDLPACPEVAVLGAGIMGGGISWLFSRYDIPVRVKDLSWDALEKSYQGAAHIYHSLEKHKKSTPHETGLKMHRISATTDYSGFSKYTLVIEAIVEDVTVKKNVLKELEKKVSRETIIATNTSSLSVNELASALRYPERCIGMHFFNPVNRMPLVEIIPGKKTSKKTIQIVTAFTHAVHKTPIVVQDGAGFLVNRVLMPYLNEALLLLEEGIDFALIDKIFITYGMPMGPFALLDAIGFDVAYKASKRIIQTYSKRMLLSTSLPLLIENKMLGNKSGSGFYLYNEKHKKVNKQVYRILAPLLKRNNRHIKITPDIILKRCVFSMINEASYCLQEKIIEDHAFLDMAMIMGTGFPAFRGGLLRYADSCGLNEIIDTLLHYATTFGYRFRPSDYLLAMVKKKRLFYS